MNNDAAVADADLSVSLKSLPPRIKPYSSNETLPPLDSLLGTGNYQNITGDVSYLLDFVIIGEAKCGTSTMMSWLGEHPEVHMYGGEMKHIARGNVQGAVTWFYKQYTSPYELIGYKNPTELGDLRSHRLIRENFPQARLVVGLRHPVRWFESMYNYRIQNGYTLPDANKLKGGCGRGMFNTCTDRAWFHIKLSILGKTKMNTTDELEPLKRRGKWTDTSYVPNPIFLYEVDQLSDKNASRAELFRRNFHRYLGLNKTLAQVHHVKPGHAVDNETQYKINQKKIDICDNTYLPLRKHLLEIATKASYWIRTYFLEVDEIHVSSREHFEEIILGWSRDPCSAINRTVM